MEAASVPGSSQLKPPLQPPLSNLFLSRPSSNSTASSCPFPYLSQSLASPFTHAFCSSLLLLLLLLVPFFLSAVT